MSTVYPVSMRMRSKRCKRSMRKFCRKRWRKKSRKRNYSRRNGTRKKG